MRDLLFLLEKAPDAIDKDWIEGVRKAWKAWMKQAKQTPYEVVIGKDFSQDWDANSRHLNGRPIMLKEIARAREILLSGMEFLDRLRQDLLINKGMWSPGPSAKLDPTITKWKEKILFHLDAAKKAFEDGMSMLSGADQLSNPQNGHFFRSEWYVTNRDFQMAVNSPMGSVHTAADEADSEISGKLFRLLSKILPIAGGSIEFGEYGPSEVNVGRMKLIFLDTPMTAADRKRFQGGRHPVNRPYYVRSFTNAFALLRRRGLTHLWYGLSYIRPKQLAPENHLGVHFGVGATYQRQGDYITVYTDPDGLAPLIIHELGHRYYYKFMSDLDRHNFDKWFGKVAATSTYGATVSSEDFAEIFSAYVMGEDLTRDQIERFKVVLGKTRKLEAIATRLSEL